ncbi:NADPH-dependent glutamate synthase [Oscillospiraceae bacterium Marseille-Q3528]|nr:NADPH-dependent glutamate synthase [Oscillospiraceae bacterium Marseille-Q3528]
MINLVREKNPMPEQSPEVRVGNFEEVSQGYTKDMAVREAMRCLKCRKKPCMIKGCPTQMRIPEFIAKVAEGDFEAAYEIIRSVSTLAPVCSRVCPHENQCEGSCVHGIKGQPVAIGSIERFVCDWHAAHCKDEIIKAEPNGHKAAVIGAGPAGLSCASDLADKGVDVTVYESLNVAGGVLVYGIPEFRLPKDIVAKIVSELETKGVKFVTGSVVGKDITVEDLMKKEGFESVFIGTGAEVPTTMNIPGEDLKGVYTANDYLTAVNIGKAYLPENSGLLPQADRVAIIGGGNVAMDACRCAARMNAKEVTVIYRRSREEMPACDAEIHEAMAENIDFRFLTNPVAVKAGVDGKVAALECVQMQLGEPDASGRRRPVAVEGSNFEIPVDAVIMAIGTKMDSIVTSTTENLATDKYGCITTSDDASTSRAGVFAGGDDVTGPLTVVKAMKAGRIAAASMDEYMNK